MLSSEGKIIGFQPTSRVAVNHWSANPLAKELYRGRKLSPGNFMILFLFNSLILMSFLPLDDDSVCSLSLLQGLSSVVSRVDDLRQK